jgi:hypothetical protein
MDELGIDGDEAMEMTGHLTESMYNRYRIGKGSKAVATGQKLREARERLQGESLNKSFNGQISPRPEAAADANTKRLN